MINPMPNYQIEACGLAEFQKQINNKLKKLKYLKEIELLKLV